MPAVKKVSKEKIIDAAVEVLRDGGFSAINARSVAKKLGCSTQPIYLSFQSMDELKAALTEWAIQLHTQRVRDSLRAHQGNDSRYSSSGMGVARLFRMDLTNETIVRMIAFWFVSAISCGSSFGRITAACESSSSSTDKSSARFSPSTSTRSD